jgi:hypothetical protein
MTFCGIPLAIEDDGGTTPGYILVSKKAAEGGLSISDFRPSRHNVTEKIVTASQSDPLDPR